MQKRLSTPVIIQKYFEEHNSNEEPLNSSHYNRT